MRPNTKLLFAETPNNPLTEVCDIAALADIAHAGGALLLVDNCFCSPALQQPVKFGADLGLKHFGGRALNALRLEKSWGSWAREYRPIYGLS